MGKKRKKVEPLGEVVKGVKVEEQPPKCYGHKEGFCKKELCGKWFDTCQKANHTSQNLSISMSLPTARNPHNLRRQSDPNQLAASIIAEVTSDIVEEPPGIPVDAEHRDDGKNPAAVALGRLGGKKGGDARAKKLSPERRKEIAQKAAAARWKDRTGTEDE